MLFLLPKISNLVSYSHLLTRRATKAMGLKDSWYFKDSIMTYHDLNLYMVIWYRGSSIIK